MEPYYRPIIGGSMSPSFDDSAYRVVGPGEDFGHYWSRS